MAPIGMSFRTAGPLTQNKEADTVHLMGRTHALEEGWGCLLEGVGRSAAHPFCGSKTLCLLDLQCAGYWAIQLRERSCWAGPNESLAQK
jgi:hypothetical protein